MRIWDTFLFRDELDLLECRLVQMDDWPVYRHVLVEARVDHQGNPKPLWYAENRERFAPWKDQIIHVVAEDMPQASPLEREGAQREAIGQGLTVVSSGDWVLLADVDEIPNRQLLAAVDAGTPGALMMTCCIFAVDWLWGRPLRTSALCRAGDVTSFAQARRSVSAGGAEIPDAGHHLTWLGGQEAIAAKAQSHCHVELNPHLEAGKADDRFYREGQNPFGQFGWTGPLVPVDVDETWPRWVHERRCPAGWFRPRPVP